MAVKLGNPVALEARGKGLLGITASERCPKSFFAAVPMLGQAV